MSHYNIILTRNGGRTMSTGPNGRVASGVMASGSQETPGHNLRLGFRALRQVAVVFLGIPEVLCSDLYV